MLDTLQILDVHFLEIIRNFFVIDTVWFRSIVVALADSEPIVFSLFLVGLWFYGISTRNN